MRFLIISDLHGSAEAFQSALEAFDHEHADLILICGDYLYHGPRNQLPIGYEPKDLVPLLNEHRDHIIGIRGNCDSEVDQMLIQFPIMSDYALLFNAGRRLFLTHGHIYSEDRHPYLSVGDILISGHTHIPVLKRNDDGIICLNPGSTTIPKAMSKPGYAILDDASATLKELNSHRVVASLDL